MNRLIQILSKIPEVRGKQKILQILDKYFGPFPAKTIENIRLSVFLSSSQDSSFFQGISRIPKWNPIHEIYKLKNNEIFVDIGANIGFYSLLAAKKITSTGKVFSFEPSSREFKRLLENVERNQIKNLCALNCALGEKTQVSSLLIEPFHSGLNKISLKTIKTQKNQNTWVLTFDQLFHSFNKKINLIKIDTEGSEWQVLQGMKNCLRNKQIKKIIIEIHEEYLRENNIKKDFIYSFLKKFGFVPRFAFADKDSYDEVFTLV